jgi:hypothetical protein
MNNKKILPISKEQFFILLLGLIFIIGACGPVEEEENNTPLPDGYPSTGEAVGYPPIGATAGVNDSPYPPPIQTDKPRFQLDLPLSAGATTVSGQAPDSLPLAIVDVTFGGVILGTGESGEDGRFSIPVTPLTEGHRIGVTITEYEPGITVEEIAEIYFPYRGEGFINVPNFGVFYDSALTQP